MATTKPKTSGTAASAAGASSSGPPPAALIALFNNVMSLAFWGLVAADHAGFVSVLDPE